MNFLTGVNPAAVQPVLVQLACSGLSGTGATDTSSGGRQGRAAGSADRGAEDRSHHPCHRPLCHRLLFWWVRVWGRMMRRAGGLLSSAGSRMGLGRFSGFFRSAGGLAGRLGGSALWAGAIAAPVLLDGSASVTDKEKRSALLQAVLPVVRWGRQPDQWGLLLVLRWAAISVTIWGDG